MLVSLNPVESSVEARPASAFAWQVIQFNSSLIVVGTSLNPGGVIH